MLGVVQGFVSNSFVWVRNFEENLVGFDIGNLLFNGVFIGIYLDFGRFFGEWMVWEDVNLDFVVMFDVVVNSNMSSFNLVVG